jgi:hypothetical protein
LGSVPRRLRRLVIPDLQAVSQSKFERKIRLGHAGLDPASSKKVNNFNWILNRACPQLDWGFRMTNSEILLKN